MIFFYEMSVECHDQNSSLSKNHKEKFYDSTESL